MSLNWTIDKIADFEALCWIEATEDEPMRGRKAGQKYLNPVTHALIWTTLAVEMGNITAKNADEFAARVAAWERGMGAMVQDGEGNDRPITLDDVRAHIGLWTNAGLITAKKYEAKLGAAMLSKAMDEQRWAAANAKAA